MNIKQITINEDQDKERIVGLDLDAIAKAYAEMGEINLEIANEMYHLESEAESSVEIFLTVE